MPYSKEETEMLHSSKILGSMSAACFKSRCRQLSLITPDCIQYLNVRQKCKAKSPLFSQQRPNIFNLETTSLGLPRISVQEFHSGSEPPYITNVERTAATYPLVNIQVKGYDFSVLQGYQAWAARVVQTMNLNISDAWASPCKKLEITRLMPKSSKVDDLFKLNIYERNVQVSNLPSPVLPILLEVLQAGLPEGVDLYVDHHSQEADQTRYVPNKELKELKQELAEVRDPSLVKARSSKFKKKVKSINTVSTLRGTSRFKKSRTRKAGEHTSHVSTTWSAVEESSLPAPSSHPVYLLVTRTHQPSCVPAGYPHPPAILCTCWLHMNLLLLSRLLKATRPVVLHQNS
ncbi:Ribosomal protein S10 domain [Trinorchestia longiramus]|nr:Ribosomal protein S10 domain [Trinorchestia longiramus]